MPTYTVRILGTHGIPAAYGGFETAAENIAEFLVNRGWRVIVYCQTEGNGPLRQDVWRGIERVHIPISTPGWRGTAKFDLRSIRHASRFRDLCLTFGYNTAVFNSIQRLKRIPNVINMDGIEWSRSRWGFSRQAILFSNERIGARVANHLIADHPELYNHLKKFAPAHKISTITYGAHPVRDAPTNVCLANGLEPGRYLTLIARPIPENSILEIVRAFSSVPRGYRLAVLGEYDRADPYHDSVIQAASDEVSFLGPIYTREVVQSIRLHSAAYLHGHTVGGTNPSLVEAMACGNPVIAHDNKYNRWVAQDSALYFRSTAEISKHIDHVINSPGLAKEMSIAAIRRHAQHFTWEIVAGQYEELLLRLHP